MQRKREEEERKDRRDTQQEQPHNTADLVSQPVGQPCMWGIVDGAGGAMAAAAPASPPAVSLPSL